MRHCQKSRTFLVEENMKFVKFFKGGLNVFLVPTVLFVKKQEAVGATKT